MDGMDRKKSRDGVLWWYIDGWKEFAESPNWHLEKKKKKKKKGAVGTQGGGGYCGGVVGCSSMAGRPPRCPPCNFEMARFTI